LERIPTIETGDILGSEFTGIVEEVGKPNGLRKGDRVIVSISDRLRRASDR
jgi:threonine dehydrogenase-like Zn-dependent dehydrogenase